MRILMMLVPDIPDQPQSGLTLDRLAEPYYKFADAGIEVVWCSPEGGAPHVAPSDTPQSEAILRFLADRAARDALSDTLALEDVHSGDFEAAFCVGISGATWGDSNAPETRMVTEFLTSGKAVAILPSHVHLERRGAGKGLLIVGELGQSPCQAADALIGILTARR